MEDVPFDANWGILLMISMRPCCLMERMYFYDLADAKRVAVYIRGGPCGSQCERDVQSNSSHQNSTMMKFSFPSRHRVVSHRENSFDIGNVACEVLFRYGHSENARRRPRLSTAHTAQF